MAHLPSNAFVPAPGTLSQWLVEDPVRNAPPHLSFAIDLPFQPFQLAGEEVSTALWLGGLDASVRHWLELAGSEPFPDPYELDGAIRLFGVPNPVEIEFLGFGEATQTSLALVLRGQIDFESSDAGSDWGLVPCSIQAELAVGPLRISKSIERRCQGDPAAIAEEVRRWVDLRSFGPLEKVPGGWQYPLLNR